MFKLLLMGALIYFAYKIFVPKSIEAPKEKEEDDGEYTDYEEVD